MAITPTSRTLEYIRQQGWESAIVERFIKEAGPFGKRKDMFGFGDIVAMGGGNIYAVQSCGQSFSEHHKKITNDEFVTPKAVLWLMNSGRLLLIGWRKVKLKRGGKAMRWRPRIKDYTLDDFETKWFPEASDPQSMIEKGREYSNAELIVVCQVNGRQDLARQLIQKPFTRPFKSDYCSMFFDRVGGVAIGKCCFFHDIAYGCGGSELMRFQADLRLAEDVAKELAKAGKEEEGIGVALAMLEGVRVGGRVGPWAWGFMRGK